jgi:hypothetical protein
MSEVLNSDPRNVIALWNETVGQWGLPLVPTSTEGLRCIIRSALKDLPTREHWVKLFEEIPVSPWRLGRVGDRGPATLEWVAGKEKGPKGIKIENYYKMLQVNYRDRNVKGGV